MTRSVRLVWVAVLALLFIAGASLCAPPESGGQRPLDQQLLKELNSRSGDDVDRELFGPEPKGGSPRGPSDGPAPKEGVAPGKTADGEKGRSQEKELGRAAVSDAENPLVDIARQMREAERLIAQADAGDKTREIQEQILKELEELLKKICKQCGGQCSPSECKSQGVSQRKSVAPPKQQANAPRPKTPTHKGLKPTTRTSERPTLGKNSDPKTADPKATVQGLWGLLPERDREQMMKLGPPEQFLPKYELLIEEYYKRLTDEKQPKGE